MSSIPPATLADLRTAIDRVDDTILGLLNERASLAQQVGDWKARHRPDGSMYVAERERDIVSRLMSLNPGPFPSGALQPVFQEIFSACLSLERPLRVAYAGVEGGHAHGALRRQFGLSAEPLPCADLADVFRTVAIGEADHGLLPVASTEGGLLDPALEAFLGNDLPIVAEVLLPATFHVALPPGLEASRIQRIHAHGPTLERCRSWLEAHYPGVSFVLAPSPAEAARSARTDPAGAALASDLACNLAGLQLHRRVALEGPDPIFRFFVLGRQAPAPSGRDRTSLLLTLKDGPGALLQVLQPLATRGISLSRLESRPAPGQGWDYAFFLDLEGHQSDPAIAGALTDLRACTASLKVLGSYPATLTLPEQP